MSERVRADFLGNPGPVCDPADDPPGTVPVQPPPVRGQEHRTISAFAGGQVDRPRGPRRQRDSDDLAALAGDGQRPVPALQAQLLDVGAGGLRDPQPVQREQGDQRMLGRQAEPGLAGHPVDELLLRGRSGAMSAGATVMSADAPGRTPALTGRPRRWRRPATSRRPAAGCLPGPRTAARQRGRTAAGTARMRG
jgi:hypothetical protein